MPSNLSLDSTPTVMSLGPLPGLGRHPCTEPSAMPEYLDAWLEEAPEDATGIARALGDIACAKGTTQVAREGRLSRESRYKALVENGNPTFATVIKVANALGVRFHAPVA